MRRLYFIGQGGSSWRDPRNWSRSPGGRPVAHVHVRGGESVEIDRVDGHVRLDLRGMRVSEITVHGYAGTIRYAGGGVANLGKRSSRIGVYWRRRAAPKIPRAFRRALRSVGGWEQAISDRCASLLITPKGSFLVPRIAGGTFGFQLVGSAGNAQATASGASNTPSYGQSPTANNLLVLWVDGYIGSNVPAQPSGWSTGAQAASTGTAGQRCSSSIFYKIAAGGDSQPTIAAISGVAWTCKLAEFSGNAISSVLENAASATAANPLTATISGADAVAGNLVVGCAAARWNSAVTNSGSHALNNGATATSEKNDSTSTANHFDFAYGITTGHSSADSDTYAFSGSWQSSSLTFCSFKPLAIITQTATVTYEARQGISATKAVNYEATGKVGPTATLTYEALTKLAPTYVLPWFSSGGLTATATLPLEAPKKLAATDAVVLEALTKLAAPAGLPWYSSGGLAAIATLPLETLTKLAGTNVLPFEAVKAVAATVVLPLDAGKGLLAIAVVPIEGLIGVAGLTGIGWESRASVQRAAGLPFEAAGGLRVFGLLPFEALQLVKVFAGLPWEERFLIAGALTGHLTAERTGVILLRPGAAGHITAVIARRIADEHSGAVTSAVSGVVTGAT